MQELSKQTLNYHREFLNHCLKAAQDPAELRAACYNVSMTCETGMRALMACYNSLTYDVTVTDMLYLTKRYSNTKWWPVINKYKAELTLWSFNNNIDVDKNTLAILKDLRPAVIELTNAIGDARSWFDRAIQCNFILQNLFDYGLKPGVLFYDLFPYIEDAELLKKTDDESALTDMLKRAIDAYNKQA